MNTIIICITIISCIFIFCYFACKINKDNIECNESINDLLNDIENIQRLIDNIKNVEYISDFVKSNINNISYILDKYTNEYTPRES